MHIIRLAVCLAGPNPPLQAEVLHIQTESLAPDDVADIIYEARRNNAPHIRLGNVYLDVSNVILAEASASCLETEDV